MLDRSGEAPKLRRPTGVASTTIMWASGSTPPASVGEYKLLAQTSKTSVPLYFPTTLPAGATVWLMAFYTNAKGESGPACNPVQTNLPGNAANAVDARQQQSEPDASPMKIAA